MKPYYEDSDSGITIHLGDALRVLPELERNSVDVLITDPPYSSGGMIRGDRVQDVHTKYVHSNSFSGAQLSAFTGDNRDQRGFGFWVALWLGAATAVLKPGAIAALFTDWRQLPVTTDALQAGGFVFRGIVPWFKPGARPTQGRWSNACEYLAWGTNGPRELAGGTFPGFYQCNTPRGEERDHITQKPLALMRDLLAIVPEGGVVIDPFVGCGTTLRAAKDLGLRAIGIELDPHYCEIAVKRLAQQTLFAADASA